MLLFVYLQTTKLLDLGRIFLDDAGRRGADLINYINNETQRHEESVKKLAGT